MSRSVAAIATLGVLAAAGAAQGAGPGCHSRWPVVAYRATPSGPRAVHMAKRPIACGVSTGYPTSETTLAVANTGTILFSPANSENTLARSSDRGAHWQLVGPTALQYTSLWNTVDPQVVVDPRTGRAFWVHATYTEDLRWPLPDQSPASWLTPTVVANAHGFQVYRSSDSGHSWQTADYSHENTADWEKLFVGPPRPRGSGAPPPSGYPDVVYVCANAPLEVTGPGRSCYRSLDGGRTFTGLGYLFPSAGAPSGCPPLAANTGVVTPDGTVYIPQSCATGTYVGVSRDEGSSFIWLPVPGAPATNGLGAVVQLAADRAGDLYMAWLSGGQLKLVRSRDGGRSWSAPLVVSPTGLQNITLPALAAGPRGYVGVVYYATSNASAQRLSGYVSATTAAHSPQPLFYAGALNDPAHPIFESYGDTDSPRADFVGAAYDRAGDIWAGLVKQLGPPDSSNRIATTGYVGRLSWGGRSSRRGAER